MPEEEIDIFANRELTHPTSDFETTIHLLKGSLGGGILAIPFAFQHSGLFFGLAAIIIVGFICTYCVHLLVKCAHELCRREKILALAFDETAELAFKTGPENLKKFAATAKGIVNTFLVIDLLGCCCIYTVFVAKNIKQVVDNYTDTGEHIDVRLYMVFILPGLIAINMIGKLKWLAPLSLFANLCIIVGLGITFYYIFIDLPALNSVPAIVSILDWPIFFGTAIFALEGIGVVMALENNMKTPTHFIGCPSVLNVGMTIVVVLYGSIGFFGYLKYGVDVKGSITLSLPQDEVLAQCVKIMIAVAIFITHPLQFYVPFGIIWRYLEPRLESKKVLIEYSLRTFLVVITTAIAISIPNLGGFISLIGAVCLSILGLIAPPFIEIITFWANPGMGRYNWILWKNCFLIIFGVVGFVTGTYVSIIEIINDLTTTSTISTYSL